MQNAGKTHQVREVAEQLDQTCELARLRAELEIERLRFDVALAVVGSITDVVPDQIDQKLVIDEVIRRWGMLTARERESYRRTAPSFGVLTYFAWTTIDAIGQEPFAGISELSPPSEYECEKIYCSHWSRFVQRLRSDARGRAS